MTDSNEPVIEIRAIRKLSISRADLIVADVERVAVVGRTGEGKSVLLKCALGLLRPESGTVRVLGKNVDGRPVVVDGLGVAFQSPALFDTFSIAENLRFASEDGLGDEEISELLASVDLGEIHADSSVTRLSGGQQKRLALLRALLRGSRLVVLDEPTSGLDPETSARIAQMLVESFDRNPRALLLVTHDYETAVRLCSRIMLLTAEGTLKDVTPPSLENVPVAVASLRQHLITSERSRKQINARRPVPWGFTPLVFDFLASGLPLSIAMMSMMGAMLVAQSSAGVRPIDMSRHIPGGLVIAVFREVAPLLVGLLLASRIGARVASELAGMSYTSQLDSLRLLGLSPARRLLLPFLLSTCTVFPICILVSGVAALVSGGLYAGLPFARLSIGTTRFFDLASEAFAPSLALSCIIKGLLMGALVVVAAYRFGTRSIESAPALGLSVTRAAVTGAVAVIASDVVLSWIFFA